MQILSLYYRLSSFQLHCKLFFVVQLLTQLNDFPAERRLQVGQVGELALKGAVDGPYRVIIERVAAARVVSRVAVVTNDRGFRRFRPVFAIMSLT